MPSLNQHIDLETIEFEIGFDVSKKNLRAEYFHAASRLSQNFSSNSRCDSMNSITKENVTDSSSSKGIQSVPETGNDDILELCHVRTEGGENKDSEKRQPAPTTTCKQACRTNDMPFYDNVSESDDSSHNNLSHLHSGSSRSDRTSPFLISSCSHQIENRVSHDACSQDLSCKRSSASHVDKGVQTDLLISTTFKDGLPKLPQASVIDEYSCTPQTQKCNEIQSSISTLKEREHMTTSRRNKNIYESRNKGKNRNKLNQEARRSSSYTESYIPEEPLPTGWIKFISPSGRLVLCFITKHVLNSYDFHHFFCFFACCFGVFNDFLLIKTSKQKSERFILTTTRKQQHGTIPG